MLYAEGEHIMGAAKQGTTQVEGAKGREEGTNSEATVKEKGISIYLWVCMGLMILFLLFVTGLVLGYAVLGDAPVREVFQYETWKHIIDLIFAP